MYGFIRRQEHQKLRSILMKNNVQYIAVKQKPGVAMPRKDEKVFKPKAVKAD
jgi:hypothetical protein